MNAPVIEPWMPARATEEIRKRAVNPDTVHWTQHARQQMFDRDLLMGDVLHLLKTGYVYGGAEPATIVGTFKYRIEGSTPNSNRRMVVAIVIPSPVRSELKIVTVMWRDEDRQKGG